MRQTFIFQAGRKFTDTSKHHVVHCQRGRLWDT